MTVNEVSRNIISVLTPRFGGGEAKAMMRIIFENIKGWTPVDIAVKWGEEMSDFIIGKINEVVERIMNDEPIQYVFGNAYFYGLKLKVTSDTLIPRPETAELVDIIVHENTAKDLRVLDLCTGSGCIAVALARNLPFAQVTATDLSAAALAVARENARTLRADVDFIQADILKGEPADAGPFDIIVSNPPYIARSERRSMEANVLAHEPAMALFVPDSDPLMFYRAVLRYAAGGALAPRGKLYFEVNPLFADALVAMAQNEGFSSVEIARDSFGKRRFASISR